MHLAFIHRLVILTTWIVFVVGFGSLSAQDNRPSSTGNTQMLQSGNDPLIKFLPTLTAEQRADLLKFYREITNDPTWRRWLLVQRKDQLADPLNREVTKALYKHKEGLKFLPGAWEEARRIVRHYNMDHRANGTVMTDEQGEKILETLRNIRKLASVMPFSDETLAKLEAFAVPGPMNAYTWGNSEFIGIANFDDIMEQLQPMELAQVNGHELGHDGFDHIPEELWLDAIFYATAVNLIPPETPDEAKDSDTDSKSKKLEDVRAARKQAIETALTRAARELIAHSGKVADHNPRYVAAMREVIRSFGDKIAMNSNPERLKAVATDLIRAARGLPADAKVEPTKDEEKQYLDDKDRLSRSKETSSDRWGAAFLQLAFEDGTEATNKLLSTARRAAYLRLVGSRYQDIEASLKQIDDYFSRMTDPEVGAAFRNPGSSHPFTPARTAQMNNFEESDAFLVVTNPILSLIFDYLAITEDLIELRTRVEGSHIAELVDREIDDAKVESYKRLAQAMSSKIQEIVVQELTSAEKARKDGKPATWNITRLLYQAIKAGGLDKGNRSSWIPGRSDTTEELGRPRRLVNDLVLTLKSEAKKLGYDYSKYPDSPWDTLNPADGSKKPAVVKPVAPTPAIIQVIKLFEKLIPANSKDDALAAIDALYTACKSSDGRKHGPGGPSGSIN